MLKIKYHSSFKRDYKRLKKRGMNMELLHQAIELLVMNKTLPARYRNHAETLCRFSLALPSIKKSPANCHILPKDEAPTMTAFTIA